MGNPLVLTFDIGTQSMRGMLVSNKGEILAFEQIFYNEPYISPEPTWAEQTPNFYFDNLCIISQNLKKNHKTLFNSIKAITVTSMRDCVLCLDKDRNPLRNTVLWLDKRDSSHALDTLPLWFKLLLKIDKIKEIVEHHLHMAPCNWISEHEKEIWEKTDKYVVLPTYINYLLTGNLSDSVANMIGYLPMNYNKKSWLKGFGIMKLVANVDRKRLIDLCEPGDTIGYITEECSAKTGLPCGVPLIATGSDKSCEALGSSALKPHQVSVSFGTTVTIQLCTKKYFKIGLLSPLYPSVVKDSYNAEEQIYRGYWMASWFKKEIAHEESLEAKKLGVSVESILSEKLFDIPAGCDGLVLQPYWGARLLSPSARGAIIGFSGIHTKIHIYKAIVEGIGFAMLEGMYTLQKSSKINITEAYVTGGASQSDKICQIMANISGIPIRRVQTHEACGLGSSIVAFVALGEYESYDEAVKHMCHLSSVFEPNMIEHAIYSKLYKNVYLRMYGKLEPLYRKIIKIMGNFR